MTKSASGNTPASEFEGSASFFAHRSCPHFPCHEGVDPDRFNCLFCYCPLYLLGDACGGNFTYLENGTKSCEHCTLPHEGDAGAALVAGAWPELDRRARSRA